MAELISTIYIHAGLGLSLTDEPQVHTRLRKPFALKIVLCSGPAWEPLCEFCSFPNLPFQPPNPRFLAVRMLGTMVWVKNVSLALGI